MRRPQQQQAAHQAPLPGASVPTSAASIAAADEEQQEDQQVPGQHASAIKHVPSQARVQHESRVRSSLEQPSLQGQQELSSPTQPEADTDLESQWQTDTASHEPSQPTASPLAEQDTQPTQHARQHSYAKALQEQARRAPAVALRSPMSESASRNADAVRSSDMGSAQAWNAAGNPEHQLLSLTDASAAPREASASLYEELDPPPVPPVAWKPAMPSASTGAATAPRLDGLTVHLGPDFKVAHSYLRM
eukprot:351773-Chlamydomonas_euryale.AAC.18